MNHRIDEYGDPLAFRCRAEQAQSTLLASNTGELVLKCEARQLAVHQKEAVVTEGDGGAVWRLAADEGLHLKGTDLAPFPLGHFNAGIQADLLRCLHLCARDNSVVFDAVAVEVQNRYWLTGSFVQGTGEGHAEPTRIGLSITSRASGDAVKRSVETALAKSPALALLRTALTNTFALYVNGRRRDVAEVAASSASDCDDPFMTYTSPPRPLAGETRRDLVRKTGDAEIGTVELAPAETKGRIIRPVMGRGTLMANGEIEMVTYLQMPGASHFRFRTHADDRSGPSGLALLAAGVAFCYMTQLGRYIEHMKLAVGGVRLVQLTPFAAQDTDREANAVAQPIDTHLFLNGDAPEDVHAKLLRVAAHTCYLHATAAAALEPTVQIEHNGITLA